MPSGGSRRAARKLGTAGGGSKGKIAPSPGAPPPIRSAFLLPELGGVFDQFLLFLFGFLERNRSLLLFLVLGGLDLLGLQIGIDLLGADRLQLLLDRRCRPRAARLEKRLRVERRRAFRAD